MECRKILLAMRHQREEELKNYIALCAKFNDSHLDLLFDPIEKRRAILALELPFTTDAVNINEARLAYVGKIQDDENAINTALMKLGRGITESCVWADKRKERILED